MPRLAVLDDSKQAKGHPILSVGGFVTELGDVPTIEERWRGAKIRCGRDADREIKFAGTGSDPDPRPELFRTIGSMPIQALVVLLEDFRPRSMRLRKETRKDAYVHQQAFEYALQRIGRQYVDGVPGPHLVALDRRDDFALFEEAYSGAHRNGWRFERDAIEPLSRRGSLRASSRAHTVPSTRSQTSSWLVSRYGRPSDAAKRRARR